MHIISLCYYVYFSSVEIPYVDITHFIQINIAVESSATVDQLSLAGPHEFQKSW